MPKVEGLPTETVSVAQPSGISTKQPSEGIRKTCDKLEKALKRLEVDPSRLEESRQQVRNCVTRKTLESSTSVNLKEIVAAPSPDIQRLAATLMVQNIVAPSA